MIFRFSTVHDAMTDRSAEECTLAAEQSYGAGKVKAESFIEIKAMIPGYYKWVLYVSP